MVLDKLKSFFGRRLVDHNRARQIMRWNFLGLEEIEKAYGDVFSDEDRAKLAQIPFDEATLMRCHNTHVLVAGSRMSINDIRRNPRVKGSCIPLFAGYEGGDTWYEAEPFANKPVEVGWYLVRREPVRGSTDKNYAEQHRTIPRSEQNPWVREVVFAAIALFLIDDQERLFKRYEVRCRDADFRGQLKFSFRRGGCWISHDMVGSDGRSYRCGICSVRYS